MNTERLHYSIILTWSDADEGYIATCPEFPGLSAFGATPEAALAEAQVAIKLFEETYQSEGLPLPEASATYSVQASSVDHQSLCDKILTEARQGNVVFAGMDGLYVVPMDEFIAQPTKGILYDLNRSKEVTLTMLDEPKWVNDFAVALVIERLKRDLETQQVGHEAVKREQE